MVILAALYALFARIGLLLDPVGGFATVVWAPSGVAIAAILLFGRPLAVGVWLGAFAANALSGAPLLAAALIASGNTLEALVAAVLLARVRGFDRALPRLDDVLWFAAIAAVAAPVVSATIGVAALVATGVVASSDIGATWRAWWVGDCIGMLLVAPAILVWHAERWSDVASRAREGAALLLALVTAAGLIFLTESPLGRMAFLGAYLVFPLLVWAAMRFEQRGAATAVLVVSLVAIIGTARGNGPFGGGELHDDLFALQTFMGIVALSALAFAAAIAERQRAAGAAKRLLAAANAADRAKSDFLAAMSHELRTPLNAIAGYAQMLSLEVHGPLTTEQRTAIGRIETNQRHLAALVADVLSFTRNEAGRLTMSPTAVSVPESLSALTAFVAPDAQHRGVRLAFHAGAEPLGVLADAERLRQILVNLLVNAIKFSNPGGEVTVAAERAGEYVRISITDTGIGIPADQLAHVFEPFYQVERGHLRRYAGVGLGLTISRELARAMGGDIEIASTPGAGTTVTLILPAADVNAEPTAPPVLAPTIIPADPLAQT